MGDDKFELEITGPTTAYLKLPTHPGVLKGARSVPLVNLLGAYQGPCIVFDFDQQGILVGIEVIGDDEDEEAPPEATGPGD